MKTKHVFGLVAVVAVIGFAASAQAGWSVGISFPAPVVFAPAVVVAAPSCLPPVVYCPPRVPYCPPQVVYAPAPCRPVVYVAPRGGHSYGHRDYRGYNQYRGQGGWGHNDRGHDRGGHR